MRTHAVSPAKCKLVVAVLFGDSTFSPQTPVGNLGFVPLVLFFSLLLPNLF